MGSGNAPNPRSLVNANRWVSQPYWRNVTLSNSQRRFFWPVLFSVICDGLLRQQVSRFLVGSLGTLIFGLAALVIFTLAFSVCVPLFGDNSLPFHLILIVQWRRPDERHFLRELWSAPIDSSLPPQDRSFSRRSRQGLTASNEPWNKNR